MPHQVILKKGIDRKTADQACLDQILQGALPNHLIILKLLLKGACMVPTYSELMREVQEAKVLLEEKSLVAKDSAVITRRREKVSACVAMLSPAFWIRKVRQKPSQKYL